MSSSRSGTLWVYGDSLGVRFFGSISSRDLCKKLYKKCQNSYNWLYPIASEGRSKKEDDDLDFSPVKVLDPIRSVLGRPEMQRNDSLLLLNLGLHYPVSLNFTTYQKIISDVIKILRATKIDSQGKRVPKYNAKVIWKSTTVICKYKAGNPGGTGEGFFTPQVCLTTSNNTNKS